MNRRQFLKTIGSGVLASAICGCSSGLQKSLLSSSPDRPNIVFILTDDQRWDAMSCVDNSFLKTPNIDRIRNEGVLFKNAFVTTSLCSPSRVSFLTSTYAHIHGITVNDAGVDFNFEKMPHFLQILRKQADYKTAYIGKWHIKGSDDNPRPGFDYWLSFKDQGVYFNPTLNENGTTFTEQGYTTDILTDYTVEWIKRNSDQPFCLYLSHKAVHHPFQPAPRHEKLYNNAKFPDPPARQDNLSTKPRWQRLGIEDSRFYRSKDLRAPAPERIPPELAWKPPKSMTDYYNTIQAVDDCVGRIYETLEQIGQLNNTIIIFAGDNGFFWKEHQRGDKRLAYEDSIRIPLVMRYPKVITAGSSIDKMVLNIDMAPTLLDLAGVKTPVWMQGRSVKPLFQGKNANWRKSFLYEYWLDINYATLAPTTLAVRTEDSKYIHYPDIDDIDELYDLKKDPYEMNNLIDNSAYKDRLKQMKAELKTIMKQTNYKKYPNYVPSKKPFGIVLDLDFSENAAGNIIDKSGYDNKFIIKGASIVETEIGKALQFSGNDYVTIEKSNSLDPSNCPWTIEILFKAAGNGIILAHGAEPLGYMLFIENGIAGFAVRDSRTTYTADAKQNCINKWTHLVATINNHKAGIYIDGKYIDSIMLSRMIYENPAEGISIGADIGQPVDNQLINSNFTGLIRSIKIYRQAMTAKDIKKLYVG